MHHGDGCGTKRREPSRHFARDFWLKMCMVGVRDLERSSRRVSACWSACLVYVYWLFCVLQRMTRKVCRRGRARGGGELGWRPPSAASAETEVRESRLQLQE